MDFSKRLAISYYKNIATLNDEHQIYMVQHQETKKIFLKKILNFYNASIYDTLKSAPIKGTPKIIEIYEEASTLTVIEEYIHGETLQDKINACSLTQCDIKYYIQELCIIVNKLHSLDPPIIHRDIKPSNIIITPYNHVVLLDFNAAKYFTVPKSSDTVLIGTKGYAAPEQYGFGSSSQQTDIYAIGMLLKELTSVLKIQTHQFDDIILRCTEINPKDQFQSVSDLFKALCTEPNNDHENVIKIKSRKSLLPPGFRTHTPWRMAVATMGYLFLFWLCLTLELKNTSGILLWLERLCCLSVFLSIVFVPCNYLNVQKIMPLCKHPNTLIKYIGIAILNIIFISIIMFSMITIEALFFL